MLLLVESIECGFLEQEGASFFFLSLGVHQDIQVHISTTDVSLWQPGESWTLLENKLKYPKPCDS